jgi:hypothetical protein
MATAKNRKAAASKTAAKKSAKKAATPTTKASAAEQPERPVPSAAGDARSLPLGDHGLDTHVIASTLQQTPTLAAATAPDHVVQAVSQRQQAIQKAVADRSAAARRAAEQVPQMEAAEQAQLTSVANSTEGVPRAPLDNPTRKPLIDPPAGIHPDVTSSTSHALDMPVPGTGVAEITDLAPGQDISPSPPISSSNILPQPNKPGSLYSKL